MKEVEAIYKAVKSLTKRYGRKFTPDGVLVGTLGEVLAEEKYDLELLPPKTEAFDAAHQPAQAGMTIFPSISTEKDLLITLI